MYFPVASSNLKKVAHSKDVYAFWPCSIDRTAVHLRSVEVYIVTAATTGEVARPRQQQKFYEVQRILMHTVAAHTLEQKCCTYEVDSCLIGSRLTGPAQRPGIIAGIGNTFTNAA